MNTFDFAKNLGDKPTGVIAIDGDLGAGKSIAAEELSKLTQIPVVHVDDFLVPNKGCYVDSIDFSALDESIRKLSSSVIVEGICLLDVLNGLNLTHSKYIYMERVEEYPYKESALLPEVQEYFQRNGALINEARVLLMNGNETNQLDVDIAYLKAKALVAVVLSIGGMIALAVGAYVLTSGISSEDSAVFRILGAEISAEGIGAVILASSVLWAYFAYLARPKYSRRKEIRNETDSDGSHRTYEFESSTMLAAKPPERPL